MNKLQIRHPDGREQVVETEDAFGALENIFGTDVEIESNGSNYWIEEQGVSAVLFDD